MELIFLKYIFNINTEKTIKIFGENFIEKNRGNCLIITNQREYELSSHIDAPKIKNNQPFFEIVLKIIRPLTSLKDMFLNCENLISFTEYNLNTKKLTDISNMFYE